MSKSKIEWCDYAINPVKGLCPVACSYCYARRMYKRFKWAEKVTWWPPAWDLVDTLKQPSRIFVGSTFELFHESLPENWMEYNLLSAKKYPQHTFIFLTKRPENLAKWSPFPSNVWVGVSATNQQMYDQALLGLFRINAKVRFVSLEPLLEKIALHLPDKLILDWLIIGQQTPVSLKTMPRLGWVEGIVAVADKASIPVFLKDNLISCVDQYDFAFKNGNHFAGLRHEMPNGH